MGMRPREWGRRWSTTSSSTRCRHRASAVVSIIRTFECAAWPRVDCVLPCGIHIYMCVSPDACRLFSVYVSPSCSDLELVFYSVGVISSHCSILVPSRVIVRHRALNILLQPYLHACCMAANIYPSVVQK